MVANIGPAGYNYEETLSTLRYANRAKNITNKPHINEDPKDAMLREFQGEIARLKAQLLTKEQALAPPRVVEQVLGLAVIAAVTPSYLFVLHCSTSAPLFSAPTAALHLSAFETSQDQASCLLWVFASHAPMQKEGNSICLMGRSAGC